jgi:hypothetical protein
MILRVLRVSWGEGEKNDVVAILATPGSITGIMLFHFFAES